MRTNIRHTHTIPIPLDGDEPEQLTLLELVRAVSEETDDESEVVATVRHMLLSGRVRLCGNFRNHSPKDFS